MAIQTDFAERLTGWRTSLSGLFGRVADAIVHARFPYHFPSVTWHIAILNLLGLIFLVVGIFLVRSTEAWLIDAKQDSLEIQGEMIAAAIAGSAQVSTGRIVVNPDELAPTVGRDLPLEDDIFGNLELLIRPERIAPVLKKLVQPTNTRARIYTDDAELILDSEYLESQVSINRRNLPPPGSPDPTEDMGFFDGLWDTVLDWFRPTELPIYKDIGGANGKAYPELVSALRGERKALLLVNQRGQHMVTVAVPIQRMTRIMGVLLISTQGSEIDTLLRKERQSILWVAVTAALAMLALSGLLAATISLPLHRLSRGTERVKSNLGSRESLPNYTHRADEIGMLSGSLREMTNALYQRIERSERFAADVAHELKNPLTSVRSAAETFALVKTDEHRAQLASTIQHDVKRLTRLIDDISNATRFEAEMALGAASRVDVAGILNAVADMFNDTWNERDRSVTVELARFKEAPDLYFISGHETRLAQVFTNVIDNALSFSPEGGVVEVSGIVGEAMLRIEVLDNGPGIPEESIENVFNRFYTDRPGGADDFGNNSGLGLSIARDIIEAHKGKLWAENRSMGGSTDTKRGEKAVTGARFIIELPLVVATRVRNGRKR